MAFTIPDEIREAAAKEAARKEAWFRLPGLGLSQEGLTSDPSEYVRAIADGNFKANIKLSSVIDFWGDETFVVVTTNTLSPRQFILAISEEKFTEEFFR